MHVSEIMKRSVVTVRPDESLRDVAGRLVEHGISGVPVVGDSGAVLGIVSEADFLIRERGLTEARPRLLDRLFGRAAERPAAELAKLAAKTAGEAMTSPAIVVTADTPVREAARIMSDRQINRLPVIEGERLVGIVTRADIVRAFVRTDEELRRAILDDVVRRAMWLDDRQVSVDVDGAVVRITGTVERRSDVATLERLVREIPGVLDVELDVSWRLDDADIRPPRQDMVGPAYGPR
jgi:CBS domain-containing protein